jgi:hypothetical protein
MLSMTIDRQRLRHDITLYATQSRQTKRTLRAPWSRPMADEQKQLHRLARLLTERLVLLAWSRGRLHVTTRPRELGAAEASWDPHAHAARIAGRIAPDYGEAREAEALR